MTDAGDIQRTIPNNELLSPELKLVLDAIRIEGNAGHYQKGIPEEINWPQVTGLAVQHGVLPLVYEFLRKWKKGCVSSSALLEQRTLYLSNVARNLRLTRKLLGILDTLSSSGYRAVPFRGPVIAVQAYGDIGLRAFCDLDLLTKPEDFPSIYDLIESEGFIPSWPLIGKMKPIWKKTRRSFEFQGKNMIIDFHQQICPGPSFLEMTTAFNELTTVELLSKPVPALSVGDSILMLILHGTHHGWNTLKMVADFAYHIHAFKAEIEWKALIEKAGKMGCLRMLLTGFLLGRDFCGLEVPSVIRELIRRDKKVEQLVVHFSKKTLEKKKSDLVPVTATLRSLDSAWYRFRYLLYFLFNPTNLDVLAIRLPGFMYSVYYVIRPLRLFFNLIGKGVKKLKEKLSKSRSTT